MANTSHVEQLFRQAIQYHSDGNLAQALQAYEQVLRLDPNHFDALHNTGIAAFQSGNFDAAASFIRSALKVDADHAGAHSNLGNALRELQFMDDALQSYDRALALTGDDANTLFNRAVTLQSLMRNDEALQAYDQVLALAADDDQAWNNRALLLWQARQYDLALLNADQALQLNPQAPDAHLNRGNILRDTGNPDSAEHSYRQALALAPEYPDAHYNLGRLLLAQGRADEALQAHDEALRLQPQLVQAQRQRALALQQLQRTEDAQQAEQAALALQGQLLAAYRQQAHRLGQLAQHGSAAALYAAALELDSSDTELQQLHAAALDNSKQHDAVLTSLRHALALKMERAARHGAAELVADTDQEKDYEKARVALEKLIKMAPNNPLAYINLGSILNKLGFNDQALASYDRALAMDANLPLAMWNRSLLLLARGDYERGWQGYEYRWVAKDLALSKAKRHFLKPQWTGRESLKGKTILLHAEQGLGDAIQFSRFAKTIQQRGARVVLEVWAPLIPLMRTLEGVDQLIESGTDRPPAFDYHIPLLSLPHALNTRIDTIPSAPFYLRSDPAKREQWSAELGFSTKLRVGVVWSGSATHGNDHNRTLPLSALAPLFNEDYEFICLQKEIRPADKELLDTLPVRQVSHLLNNFGDTAALCDLMDVVITVDTSVAHLAGALGKPFWVMLPTPFEWRWLEHGSTNPWYPSATLFRQRQIGDWAPVVNDVIAALNALPPPAAPTTFQLHTS
ncbi:tetratricopeptide repeat protein [Pseudoduganella sp. FT26W]|uniref:Tetratricopeptide repeat protein n=1 Tax=Duganella aquatilis TaxID=2666082 RepID=A0A844D4P7_9BURK|nr:tetratricopeptide repeat protein [Duganella aquatilis]MRW82490.1 tetratricopeptide repeat protein [Duganella aquatilis]